MKNKKNNPFSFVFKTITNLVFYSGIVLAVFLIVALIALSVFPDYFQDKISLPVHLDIKDTDSMAPRTALINNLGKEASLSFKVTCLTRDLFVIRVLLLYYFIIILGGLIALFFWKKILNTYQKPALFSRENSTLVRFLGWLLIVYVPLFYLINLFFESLVNLRISKASLDSSLSQGYHTGIFLVVLGSVILFMGKTMDDS